MQTNFLNIPGGGAIDLTTLLTGRPTYGMRQGSWEFIVMTDDIDPLAEGNYGVWYERYSEILAFLHGRAYKCILDDDPDWFYEGRFSLSDWRTEQVYSSITINYVLKPYKKNIHIFTNDDWEWDPFNFETDSVPSYQNLSVNGTLDVTIVGDGSLAIPTIIASAAGMSVSFGGQTYTLEQGTNRISGIVLQQGSNVLSFSGTGTIDIENTGGRL